MTSFSRNILVYSICLLLLSCSVSAFKIPISQISSFQKSSYSHVLPKRLFVLEDESLNAIHNNINSRIQESPLEPPYALNRPQIVYVTMSSLFITCLLIADIVGVKVFELKLPFSFFGYTAIEHSCGTLLIVISKLIIKEYLGVLTFPFTFLISDTVNEYFGPDATKRVVYLGLWMSVFVYFVVNAAQALPYLQKPFNVTPEAFNMIFGSAKFLYAASLVAYLVGQLSDIWLFGLIKRWTKGKYLWLRAGVSTVVSQLLDSFMVSYLAYRVGKQLTKQPAASLAEVIGIAVTGYGLKFLSAIVVTPLMYFLRSILEDRYQLKPLP